jgi:hypothetical protein
MRSRWLTGRTHYLAMADQHGTRMARITVRPTWIGLLDSGGDRLPGIMTPPDT